MVNAALVTFMILTIVLLIVAMVFSWMSAYDVGKSSCGAHDEDAKNAKKWSTVSTLITGLSGLAVVVALIIYVYSYRKEINKAVHEKLEQLPYGKQLSNAIKGGTPPQTVSVPQTVAPQTVGTVPSSPVYVTPQPLSSSSQPVMTVLPPRTV